MTSESAYGRAREAPEPRTSWDEIARGLWMGGHRFVDPTGAVRRAVVGAEFDRVVSLFTLPGHGPATRVEHVVVRLPDAPLTSAQILCVAEVARATARAVREGRTVLVRCHYGYNRSGLVVAQTLVELGHEPAHAISLVRHRRSPWALHNTVFADYLRTGLDVASLLSDLKAPG
ncbi:protein-tyrosine phosphatase family protein [Streptomyces sp. 4N509B]|uniref:protein-tyrosine phosphatase family protein n=1 Tax=Streptomyces sp. 4N509B TaxID=3457413 RepID=UPI003FD10F6A